MLKPWSCDTFVAQADATADGRLIFGKNSDRPAGEVQPLRYVPRRPKSERLDLAYVSIEDEPAYAHVGAAPFWCWGYEFGVNEHNVSIGNEAQFTRAWAAGVAAAKAGDPPSSGIIGMELVRLGLERGRTAIQALDAMTRLLERYGQWGSGVLGKPPVDGSYDNSYLIADGKDAWILETSGREWISRRVQSGIYSISNEPSIRTEYDRKSEGLLSTACQEGWLVKDRPFDYAATHVDPLTSLQVSHMRQRRSQQMLQAAKEAGGVQLHSAKGVLRDHFEGTFLDGPYFNAARPDFLTLCMHEHPAGFTWGNTAGSIIVETARHDDDLTTIWWTPLSPCVGAYIPIFLESGEIPESLQTPAPPRVPRPPEACEQAQFDPSGYWWKFQNLLDAAKGDPSGSRFRERQPMIRARFDQLERTWVEKAAELRRRWATADRMKREKLVPELKQLTSQAVDEVNDQIGAFLADYAPSGLLEPIDTRWLGSRRSAARNHPGAFVTR
jgi:secernin